MGEEQDNVGDGRYWEEMKEMENGVKRKRKGDGKGEKAKKEEECGILDVLYA